MSDGEMIAAADVVTDWRRLIEGVVDMMSREDLPVRGLVKMAEDELRSILPPVCPELPSTSPANPTNWLLGSRPDVYFAATMAEACEWTHDAERAKHWRERLLRKVYGPFVSLPAPIPEKLTLWERIVRRCVPHRAQGA